MKKYIAVIMAALMLVSFAACAENNEEAVNSADTETDSAVKTVSEGEMSMQYISFGSGKKAFVILPGLAVHSVLNSAAAIEEAYKDYTDEYTVYLFDRAMNIADGYTIRDMAADTAKAMKALNITSADIFGASQGGMIGLYLAIDYPELVNKLIVASSLSKPNDTFNAVVDEWVSLAEAKNETALLESFADNIYSEATLAAYRDTLISSNAGITDEEYARFIVLAKACKTFDCYDELSSITCPVLVVGSEGDKVVTPDGSKEIAEALGCEMYIYDDSYGHGVYDEAPDFRQRCLDFLAE